MSRSLHTGKIYRIEYMNCNHGMFGGDGQEAFYNILSMFDIANSAEDEFDDDYEVQRIELERLRTIIGEENETYQAQPFPQFIKEIISHISSGCFFRHICIFCNLGYICI